ncbi:hypothetical protein AURDEDRAFT_127967 [Auricularia subglabra TFB-10046 SS5]|nr:hypothetical protein AURDEDRAFT_127967 [Auricularia subglabra TFB-10046 SS5]
MSALPKKSWDQQASQHITGRVMDLLIPTGWPSDDLSGPDELSTMIIGQKRQILRSKLPLPPSLRDISPPPEEELQRRHDAIIQINKHLFGPPENTVILTPTDPSAPTIVLTPSPSLKRQRDDEEDMTEQRQCAASLRIPPRKKRKLCRGGCGKDFAQSHGRNAHWDAHPACEAAHAEKIRGTKEERYYQRYRRRASPDNFVTCNPEEAA